MFNVVQPHKPVKPDKAENYTRLAISVVDWDKIKIQTVSEWEYWII